ncbi:glycosyltransferase N-terminal domain-containing protein [Roseobacter sp. TSBP12]|uniref:3-deoxy-D-manno-octulosonic acid transferase n=1 Tax=Roseobacter sp. TSBP12 TaxID=1236613 RepID=UPI001869DDF2|nr:glycosyltransferase N-terminal domain-containing protein [Roseobacter sp. TSBP12]
MLIYRLLLTALSPLFALLMLRQLLRGRERLSDLAERFGTDLSARPTSRAPMLWVHGASNGELTGARALIEEALRRAPDLEILVTTNTVTARKMVGDWALPRVTVRLAPFDLRPVLRRFIRATQPAALVSIENEIWPNRFALLARNAIPVIVAGARMSDRTAQRWKKWCRSLAASSAPPSPPSPALPPKTPPRNSACCN